MEKVDRLGWAEGITFSPTGTKIGIRTNCEKMAKTLEKMVKSFDWELLNEDTVDILISLRVGPPSKKKGQKNFHLLYTGASQVKRTLDLDEITDYLEQILPNLARAVSKDSVYIPGALVQWSDALLVLPAVSGTGRQTLLDELNKRGGEIVSKSFFAVTTDGELQTQDGDTVKGPEKTLICFTEYSPRNKTLRAKTLTPGESSLYLFTKGLSSRRNPATALRAVSTFATSATSLRGKRGEATQAADYLNRKLGQASSRN